MSLSHQSASRLLGGPKQPSSGKHCDFYFDNLLFVWAELSISISQAMVKNIFKSACQRCFRCVGTYLLPKLDLTIIITIPSFLLSDWSFSSLESSPPSDWSFPFFFLNAAFWLDNFSKRHKHQAQWDHHSALQRIRRPQSKSFYADWENIRSAVQR